VSTHSQVKHAVIYGDSHIPFESRPALAVVRRIIQLVKPDILVNIGDLFDAWQISRFPKDPRRKETFQYEIFLGIEHLNDFAKAAPKAALYFLLGNHEERLKRAIWAMADQSRELAGLDVFEKYVNWETILADGDMNKRWNVVSYDDQPIEIIPQLLTKHGTKLASGMGASGRTAFKEWISYGMSGMSGHSHRLGDFFHRDRNGSHRWFETGCTCEVSGKVPGSGSDQDWHQGCAVLTYTDNWFNVELVYIQDGRALWRDTVIEV
jgi:hypothetical protein